MIFFIFVDDEKGKVVLLWVFDEDCAILAIAVAKLQRRELEVVWE